MKFNISPKVRVAASVIGGLLAVWLLIRACSGSGGVEDHVLLVAQDATWYPLDLRGKEQNMVVFTKALLEAIAKEEGFQVEIIQVASAGLYDGLDQGSFDAIFSSLTPNVITERRYVFSDLLYVLGPVLVIREGTDYKTLEDLRGKVIGIEAGTMQQFQLPSDPEFVIIPYPTVSIALDNLSKNAIDAVIMDVLRAYSYTHGFYEDRLKIASSPLLVKGIRIAARNEPKYHKFILKINSGLEKLIKNGTYEKLIRRFGLVQTKLDHKNEQ